MDTERADMAPESFQGRFDRAEPVEVKNSKPRVRRTKETSASSFAIQVGPNPTVTVRAGKVRPNTVVVSGRSVRLSA